ncbi:transcription termination/antitermination protein NusG [Candidatus Uabimicrobium sp. HlEnr_7]|uniref:transcription termination/antitermination protein NusG n=1 Tax=Candidatus Uabimicrobium helgolandensis TaxID=3095367 RepID=UPI003558C7E6
MSLPENSETEEENDLETSEEESAKVVNNEIADELDKKWYILRVQSNKEDRVKTNLQKRVIAENMQHVISDIVVPSELVSEIKKGSKRVVERKLYPGYVMVEMELNDETHFIVKGTPGVGDFVGPPSKPIPMSDEEVERMLANCSQSKDKPKPKVSFKKGQNIKIKEGPFENFDGIVDEVNEQKGIVKVIVGIFGRYTQVELEYWQVESL